MSDVVGRERLGLRERKKQRTRATLIDAAVALCDRQGFERTTVDQIAAAADVSPRTFSRYFATKDAVLLASIEDVVAMVAAEITRQPADVGHFAAVYHALVAAFTATKTGTPTVTAERLLAWARIVNSSPALKQAAFEYRQDAAVIALAHRMGVTYDDARLRLVVSVWGTIVMTAVGDFGADTDWDAVTVDDIVSRLTATYAQFIELTADIGKRK